MGLRGLLMQDAVISVLDQSEDEEEENEEGGEEEAKDKENEL